MPAEMTKLWADDAGVTKNETLLRRGKQWFRYDAPDKRLFKQLQKTLTT